MSFNKKVSQHIQEMNDTDKKVMNYFVNNYENVSNEKVAEVAKALYISPNAIIRFAKKLGYSGFSEMKFDILNQTATSAKTAPSLDYYSLGEKMIKNMQKTIDINRENHFHQVVESLIAANKIVFISLGVTNSITRSFIQRLEVLNKVCILSSDRDNAVTLARNLDDSFLAFFVSLSGNSDIVIQCANYFKERKIKIISLTGLSQNYLQEVSDIALYAYSEPREVDSMDIGSRIYIAFMLELLFSEISKG